MKKKTGFTLLELLVTIILIISVLGIAIVSVMELSEKQKENEYERVKQTIKDAAEQYFTSNEYIFETLDEDSIGIISVKQLVEEDYINKVVDPRNNKSINECDQVKVKRKNGKFHLEYIESNANKCESSYIKFKVIEPGAPEISLSINGTKGLNDWYTSSVSIDVNAKNKGHGNIIKLGKCINLNCTDYDKNIYSELNNSIVDSETYLDDTNYIESSYMAENEFGNKSIAYVKLRVDKTKPLLNVTTYASKNLNDVKQKNGTSYNNNWYSGYVGVEASFSDNISTPTITYKRKKGSIGGSGEKEIINSSGLVYDWSEADGESIYEYNLCDEAGNCADRITKTIKLDKQAPKVTINITHNENSWYNKNLSYSVSAIDSYTNITSFDGYWNKSGLTSNDVLKSEYKWNEEKQYYETGGTHKVSLNGTKSVNYNDSKETTFSSEGHRKLKYIACDAAGNCRTSNEVNFKIDKTPPVIKNVQKPIETYTYCINSKAIYTSFNVTDNISMIDRIDHFMDSHTDNDWYRNYTYNTIATSLPKNFTKNDIGSLISVYNGEITSNNEVFDYYYFSTKDNELGTRVIDKGYNVNRAWSYGSRKAAQDKGCGTITNSLKTPAESSNYCNYVAAKDSAGNVATRKICNDGTDVGKNE